MTTVHVGTDGFVENSAGYTLYVFDHDPTGGAPTCTTGCAPVPWAPLIVTGTPTAGSGITATIGTVHRTEGSQVTLKGRPLYTFTGDSGPGQTAGNGVAGLWHAAKPGGN